MRLKLLARQQTIALQTIACLLDADQLDTALLALAEELRTRFQCTRVVVALGDAHSIAVRAISQQARVDRRSGEIKHIERLLNRSLAWETTINWPADDGGDDSIQCFRELSATTGATQIIAIPLFLHETRMGALVLAHAQHHLWSGITLKQLEQLSHPIAAAISLHRQASSGLAERMANASRRSLSAFLRVKHPLRLIAGVGMLVGLLAIASLEGSHQIVAESDIRPVHHHVLAAPFDGFIQEVHASAGDLLTAGAVLLRLDTRALELEATRVQQEQEANSTQFRAAMATRDRAEMARLEALQQKSEAERRRLLALMDQAEIRTPTAGRVLSADLAERVGSPVERGEPLVSFAADDRFELRLLVDERDVAWIEAGQLGQLTLNAAPDQIHRFTVEAIRPIAIAANGQNRFPVDAYFEELPTFLLSGQTGIGRIDAGEARLGWIYTRRFTDWLRRLWWRWFG